MAPNLKVAKAFRAMRDLGIPEEKTKPVLKSLLRAYEKNWQLIEEENYRALADAIFDSEEAEAAEQKKKLDNAERMKAIEEETQIQEEPERPLKRLRLRHQDGQASSPNSTGTPLKRPKLEADEPATRNDPKPVLPQQAKNKGKQPVLPNVIMQLEGSDVSQSGDAERTHRIESDSDFLSRRLRDKGKEPLSPMAATHEKRSVSDKPSTGVRFKEPKVEQGVDVVPKQKNLAFIKPKDEPLTDDAPRFEVPLAVVRPESLTNGDTPTEDIQLSSNETSGQELITISDESTTKVELGSSSSGDIKISLSCNSALGKPKISDTNVDTVLKKMEEKCLKSYKLLDRKFSMKKLMNDMCECLLDLGSDSAYEGGDKASLSEIPKLPPPCNGLQPVIEQNGFGNNSIPNDISSIDESNDIAKGQESVIISLVNEVNSECPPSFHYIRQNAVFQNAYVNFSLARVGDDYCCSTCFGDCLKSSKPCACALQSGGEFAYTIEGLVKEELLDECIKMNRDPQKHCLYYCKECPLERSKNEEILEACRGHSVRSFIKECWLKCGCNKQCGNRVVQRGIKHKLQVFMTPGGKGWGLRTLEDLSKGTFVCEYVGEVLTNGELYDRVSGSSNKEEHAYPVLLDADWGAENELKDEEALCLDATYYGNVARFINHRCFDSNLVEIPVEIENPDHHYYHLAFFTTRKVKALEELTWDYGIDFDDDAHPVKAFQCQCGSRFCRNVKRPGNKI